MSHMKEELSFLPDNEKLIIEGDLTEHVVRGIEKESIEIRAWGRGTRTEKGC